MSTIQNNFWSRIHGDKVIAVLSAVAVIFVAGCGGGGDNGNSGGSGASYVTVAGTIVTSSGSPVSNWSVGFDVAQTSRYETATNSAGQYSISLPTSVLTNHDKLSVADPSGNVWYDASLSVNQDYVTVNVSLPPFDTVIGTVLQNNGSAAQNYEVRFVTADTSVNTGLYWSAYTNDNGNYTLYIPVTLDEGSTTIPVITGYDNVYINSYPSQSTMDVWDALSAELDPSGASSYTLNETLPLDPIFSETANARPYFTRSSKSAHGVAIESANRSLPRGAFIKKH
ncbi:MAG: hypothetical protein P4L33_18275 [Capsulimonadaceae bacterium]|nr:hypothetical protein [Capsulimonadaceae bacterium]